MSYCTGKSIEKQRGEAIKEVILGKRDIAIVARRYGRARSTIYRWLKKWYQQNPHLDFKNHNRPSVPVSMSSHCLDRAYWNIPTLDANPKTHPNALPESLVTKILETKEQSKRCNQVVYHLLRREGIVVSFSSVRRTIERNSAKLPRRKGKRFYKVNPKRPLPRAPGDLVETDTVHLLNPLSKERKYIVTVIDVYSRLSYAKVWDHLSSDLAAKTVLEARKKMGMDFRLVQSDNGAEFSVRFQTILKAKGIETRHTRVRHPNDNAHIERFNRTLREECIGPCSTKTIQQITRKLNKFLNYYNCDRIHLGLGCKTPLEVLQRC